MGVITVPIFNCRAADVAGIIATGLIVALLMSAMYRSGAKGGA